MVHNQTSQQQPQPYKAPSTQGSPYIHSSSQEYGFGTTQQEFDLPHGNAYPLGSSPTTNAPQFDRNGDVLPPPFAFALGTQWQTSLSDMMNDRDVCLEVLCCPYCQIGYQYNRTQKWFVEMNSCVCLAACCTDMFVFGLGYLFASFLLRQRIVDRYHLDEHTGWTIAKSIFCAPCSLCQTHREMTVRKECPGGVCIVCPLEAPPALPSMHGVVPSPPPYAAKAASGEMVPPSFNPYCVEHPQDHIILYGRSTDECFPAPSYEFIPPVHAASFVPRGSPAKTASDSYPATPFSIAAPETPQSHLTSPAVARTSGRHGFDQHPQDGILTKLPF